MVWHGVGKTQTIAVFLGDNDFSSLYWLLDWSEIGSIPIVIILTNKLLKDCKACLSPNPICPPYYLTDFWGTAADHLIPNNLLAKNWSCRSPQKKSECFWKTKKNSPTKTIFQLLRLLLHFSQGDHHQQLCFHTGRGQNLDPNLEIGIFQRAPTGGTRLFQGRIVSWSIDSGLQWLR